MAAKAEGEGYSLGGGVHSNMGNAIDLGEPVWIGVHLGEHPVPIIER